MTTHRPFGGSPGDRDRPGGELAERMGELARQVDALQDQMGEGPCLDAVFEHKTVRAPDLAADRR